jgi:hypothetical protein
MKEIITKLPRNVTLHDKKGYSLKKNEAAFREETPLF